MTHRAPARLAAALAAAGLGAAALAPSSGAATPPLQPPSATPAAATVRVGTQRIPMLNRTVLVTRSGRTLYSLSAERRGRFICTDTTCLSIWHPLLVPRGARLAGVPGLGTIRRPDGRRQATSAGRPLYTFGQDARRGDANGEGIRDVGTWHAVRAPSARR